MTGQCTSGWPRAAAVAFVLSSFACAPTTATREGATANNRAIEWTLRSAEYRATSYGIFRSAAAALPALLADETYSAALEQEGAAARGKPPAIVVDIDETMLNNSVYQWELAAHGESYDEQSWDAWIERGEARAVPGAVEYAKRALALNATIFYVTNRTCRSRGAGEACPQAADTLRNLVSAGFPKPQATQLLLQGMRPEWSNEKSSRRSHVAERHRIVQLIGDDLSDFIPAVRGAREQQRHQLLEKYRTRWGTSWFMLPNPMYGSWVNAARNGNGALALAAER